MTYGLTILAIGNTAFLEITPDEFRQIKTAKLIAMTALAIEEKFEILVENYSEYERTLLDLTLGKMIRMNFDAVSFAADRQLINRRIANLLMAARLYIDQA